ncbi:MAG: hypothetical protein M5U19_08780 [Microthrixaceae bacterium]|nr:hypothetical protein [Microthrixaceae bacterium]
MDSDYDEDYGDDEPEFDLTRFEGNRWALMVDDVTAHLAEDRYERLAVLLAGAGGIEDCIHEDRELIYFRSDLDRPTLDALIERLWNDTSDAAP